MQFARSRSSRCVPLPDDPVSTLDTVKTVRDCALNFSVLCERIINYNDVTISEVEHAACGMSVCLFVCLFKNSVSSRQIMARNRTRHVARAMCELHLAHKKSDCFSSYVVPVPSKFSWFSSVSPINPGITTKQATRIHSILPILWKYCYTVSNKINPVLQLHFQSALYVAVSPPLADTDRTVSKLAAV